NRSVGKGGGAAAALRQTAPEALSVSEPASAVVTQTTLFEEIEVETHPLPATPTKSETKARASDDDSRIVEARMKGYVGEACPECGNFTLVRNGTCLKCDTCGGTTGCS
ncbi:MAG: hypothetical protein KDA41_21615, partial [Planctomycetales bacterium]|nr:hypothetical protein [Planctomycetales bacterium]